MQQWAAGVMFANAHAKEQGDHVRAALQCDWSAPRAAAVCRSSDSLTHAAAPAHNFATWHRATCTARRTTHCTASITAHPQAWSCAGACAATARKPTTRSASKARGSALRARGILLFCLLLLGAGCPTAPPPLTRNRAPTSPGGHGAAFILRLKQRAVSRQGRVGCARAGGVDAEQKAGCVRQTRQNVGSSPLGWLVGKRRRTRCFGSCCTTTGTKH